MRGGGQLNTPRPAGDNQGCCPFQVTATGASVCCMTAPNKSRKGSGYLDGQLLIAMPLMSDKRFARSVIYMCAHSAQGAMGLIVNQRAPHISFSELLGQPLQIGKGGLREGIILDRLHDSLNRSSPEAVAA